MFWGIDSNVIFKNIWLRYRFKSCMDNDKKKKNQKLTCVTQFTATRQSFYRASAVPAGLVHIRVGGVVRVRKVSYWATQLFYSWDTPFKSSAKRECTHDSGENLSDSTIESIKWAKILFFAEILLSGTTLCWRWLELSAAAVSVYHTPLPLLSCRNYQTFFRSFSKPFDRAQERFSHSQRSLYVECECDIRF